MSRVAGVMLLDAAGDLRERLGEPAARPRSSSCRPVLGVGFEHPLQRFHDLKDI